MSRLIKVLTTRGGVLLLAAMVIAGASIAYAAIRATVSLDASFVAIEATYGLSIINKTGDALTALEFGSIVQGEASRASFGVRTTATPGPNSASGSSTGMYRTTSSCPREIVRYLYLA